MNIVLALMFGAYFWGSNVYYGAETDRVELTKGPDWMKRFESYTKISGSNREWNTVSYSDFMIDTTLCFWSSPAHQGTPKVASDGEDYFVIWSDERVLQDVYGTRVSAEGEVLDPNGIKVGGTGAVGNYLVGMFPVVGYGDGIYLCVYEDLDIGGTWVWDLFGVRIRASDGLVLDTLRFNITDSPNRAGGMAHVAFDGTNFLVVWHDCVPGGGDDEIRGARVTPEGVVLDWPNGFLIYKSTVGRSFYSDVAFDGENYLVVWTEEKSSYWSTYGTRVTPQAEVLDPQGFAICDMPGQHTFMPRVTFGDPYYFVVWESLGEDYGVRVNKKAQVLDSLPIRISPTTYYTPFASVTFDGIDYFVTWPVQSGQYKGCYGARVSKDGILLDATPIKIENVTPAYVTEVASNGLNSFTVWTEARYDSRDIFGARVNQAGVVLDTNGFIVSTQSNIQEMPVVAYDGVNYLSAWSEHRNSWDIYGKRITQQDGSIGDLIPISTRNWIEYWPTIAFADSSYLVAWHAFPSSWDIWGARVTPSGEVLDPNGITIGAWAGNQGYPSVAYGGVNWLVVWDDSRNGKEDIYGARVKKSGAVMDIFGIPISTAPLEQWFPSVAFDGDNYFIVWQDCRTGINFEIYGARLTPGGTLLDPDGICLFPSGLGRSCVLPRICFGGTHYFVTWMDTRNGNWDIYGGRVTREGVVLDPSGIPICTNSSAQGFQSVTFDGTNYIVLWEDWRSGTNCDIYGAIIDTSGEIIETIVVSDKPVTEVTPAIANGPSNKALFTYSRYASSPYEVLRAYGKYYPFIGVEEAILDKTTLLLKITPNPFTQTTVISYQLPVKSKVSLRVYDISGRLVKTLVDEVKEVGYHSTVLDAKLMREGIYFCKLEYGGRVLTQKMVLLR
ncbi:MAG: T9SS type A sorting domain-containing protein [bacterium]|nr:T9SS type A sorting domain-containing protein [bacterium]